MSKGYDAIYSQTNEEYAFLNPSFVLPEFVMHTSIRRQTCEEEIVNRKIKLQSRVQGLVEGMQPDELKTFMKSIQQSLSKDIAESIGM